MAYDWQLGINPPGGSGGGWGGAVSRPPSQNLGGTPNPVSVPNFFNGGGGVGGNYGAGFVNGYKPVGTGMYNGIKLPSSGASYFGKVPTLRPGEDYFKDVFMPKEGAEYTKQVDLVEKAGDYYGLEAEASRLLGRSGGVQAALMSQGGFSGSGMAEGLRSGLAARTMGGLAKDINEDKFARESAVQQGTLGKAQLEAQADAQLSQLEMQRQEAIAQGDYNRANLILAKQSAIAGADASRAGIQLGIAQGKAQIGMFNSGQYMQNAQNRMQMSQFNASQALSKDQFNATMKFNTGVQQQQGWLAGQQLWNDRLGLANGLIQNPSYGYVDPTTGRPATTPPGQSGGQTDLFGRPYQPGGIADRYLYN